MPEIRRIAALASGNSENRQRLWQSAKAPDRRTSINALWVMSHLTATESVWLHSLQNELTDMLLAETDNGKKRMLLQILREQNFRPESPFSDRSCHAA